MSYFVRFTETAEEDIKRGYSYHATPYGVEDKNLLLETVEEEDIEEINGSLLVKLNGLCCFEIEANTEEEAVAYCNSKLFNEVIERKGNMGLTDTYCLIEGNYTGDCIDGDLCKARKLVNI